MEIVKQSIERLYPETQEQADEGLRLLERAGRTCYKSEAKITDDSAPKFAKMILVRQHDSVVEHLTASYKIICDRALSHEIVRHRIGTSYSQESQRYINYNKRGLQFIDPVSAFTSMTEDQLDIWFIAMTEAETNYNAMIDGGCTPELARSVLPNSAKTEIVMTANLRAWRHFIDLRTSPKAHPQMREIANMIFEDLNALWSCIFEDLAR
jgi:thymidylate synthase (FAD)